MPRLLYTYLINQVLAPFYASLIILTSILFLSKLIPVLDIILDYNIALNDFIRLYAYFTPHLLLFALPMASMMGVILGAVRLTNDREIMILKACGISFYRMLPPVIIIALCTSLLTGIFSIYLIPMGNTAKAEFLFRLAKERIEHSLQEKKFSESLGDVVLYADKIDKEKKVWHGVYVSDMRKKRNPLTIIARTGTISSDTQKGVFTLNLKEGSLHRNQEKTAQTIIFQNYSLNLPWNEPARNPLAKTGKSTMTLTQLLKQAEILGHDTKAGAQLLNEFHKRLALPIGCFILTLLGFPLGLIIGPGQRPIGIPLGLFVFVFYYIFLTAGDAIGKTHLAPTTLAMWFPNAIFFIITLLLIHSTAKETFAVPLDKIYEFGQRVRSKLHWHKGKSL
jgi:lipopolysaccharide export system permease protein